MGREIGRVWAVLHEKRNGEIIWSGDGSERELVMTEGKRITLNLNRIQPHLEFSRKISGEQGYR